MVDIFTKSPIDFCGCPGTGAAQLFRSKHGWRYGTTKKQMRLGQEVSSQADYCCCGPTCSTREEAVRAFRELIKDTKHLR